MEENNQEVENIEEIPVVEGNDTIKIANEAVNERNTKNGNFIPHVDVNEAKAVDKTEASKESKTEKDKDKGREIGD